MTPSPLEQIRQLKAELGDELVILTHHYQRKEVVACGDHIGDSFVLSREAARAKARKIVFCGVHFMAEAARILARPDQQVYMPDPHAGCPMADMADAADAQVALDDIRRRTGKTVVPITYINSNADVKALVGEAGGIVCTSANAPKALQWARSQGEVLFFLPDEFLGTNTALALGYGPIVRWNPHVAAGGLEDDALRSAMVVVWQGYCHVHTYFNVAMVDAARQLHPQGRVVVHPECTPDVVQAADGAGSTGYIVRVIEEAGPGSTTIVGTEVNLVLRMADEFPDRTVVPLDYSLCPNMYRTTVPKLLHLLQTFDPAQEMHVAPEIAAGARKALERMLAL